MTDNQEVSGPSLSRLNGMVLDAMQRTIDWQTPHEIIAEIKRRHGLLISDSSCTARLRDLRKEKYGALVIQKRKRKGAKAFEYVLFRGSESAPLAQRQVCIPSGVELIRAERQRQIKVEGYKSEHDDGHTMAQIALAGLSYVSVAASLVRLKEHCNIKALPTYWPWQHGFWKPSPDPIRNLVKAGALIAAEIDRLQRKGAKP